MISNLDNRPVSYESGNRSRLASTPKKEKKEDWGNKNEQAASDNGSRNYLDI